MKITRRKKIFKAIKINNRLGKMCIKARSTGQTSKLNGYMEFGYRRNPVRKKKKKLKKKDENQKSVTEASFLAKRK